MKKEIFSVILLTVMLVAAFVNIWYIHALTDEMSGFITESIEAVNTENWELAERCAKLAEKTWNDRDDYTHVVLRHSEIDTVSDALYDYLADIYEHDAQASAAGAKKVIYHLDSIYRMEQVRFGSIF